MSYSLGSNRLKNDHVKLQFEQFMKDLGERNPALADITALKKEISSHTATLDFKESVRAASTQDLSSEASISGSATYNSTGGIGLDGEITATLSSSDTFSLDGINFSSTDNGIRIILKDQTDQQENGIYIMAVTGTNLSLDRAPDFAKNTVDGAGATMFIEQGTINGNQKWVFSVVGPVSIGGTDGTDISFIKNSGTPTMSNIGTGGQGLFKEMQGDIMRMRNLNVGSSKLTLALDGPNDELKFDVDETQLDVTNMIGTPTGAIVGITDAQTLTNKDFDGNTSIIKDTTDPTKKFKFNPATVTTGTTRTFSVPDADTTFVGTDVVQTVTNKTLDADNNTVTNLDNTSIKASAAIDVTKIDFNYQDSASDGQSTTALTSYQNKLSLVTPVIPAGTYMVMWSAQLGNATNAAKSKVRCTIDAAAVGEVFVTGSGTGEYQSFSGFKKTSLTNAAHTLEVDYAALTGTAEIANARIMLHRIGA